MQWLSRTPRSTRTSGKLLESGASAEVRTLRVHRGSKRRHEYRGRTFLSDRKVGRRGSRFVVIPARVSLPARGDHPTGRRRSIRLGKLLHTPERVRSFVG